MTRAGTKVPAQGRKPCRNSLFPIPNQVAAGTTLGWQRYVYLPRVTGFTLVLTLRPRFEEDRRLASADYRTAPKLPQHPSKQSFGPLTPKAGWAFLWDNTRPTSVRLSISIMSRMNGIMAGTCSSMFG
jgi:hypothetical protein